MLTIALALAAAQQPAMQEPSVRVEVSRDPIDDRVTAFARIRSAEGTEPATLSIGCDPNLYAGVRVMVQSRLYLARENAITGVRRYRYRFDAWRPRSARFQTERRTAWMDSRRESASFIAWTQSARQVVVRIIDAEGRRVDLTFPLLGTGPSIQEALRICGTQRYVAPLPQPR
jgi:hypothetical protein